MMEWIGIGLTAAGLLIAIGTYLEWKREMDNRVTDIEGLIQTPGEREAMAKVLEAKFIAHEDKDDLRFANLSQTIDRKLDAIIALVTRNHE